MSPLRIESGKQVKVNKGHRDYEGETANILRYSGDNNKWLVEEAGGYLIWRTEASIQKRYT